MRAEKQIISTEYLDRLNSSPFFIVVDYTGLKVGPMTELRKRLHKAGAEIHVVKNSIFRIAAKEAGIGGLGRFPDRPNGGRDRPEGCFGRGQGLQDLSALNSRSRRLSFGFLNNQRLEAAALTELGGFASIGSVARQASWAC